MAVWYFLAAVIRCPSFFLFNGSTPTAGCFSNAQLATLAVRNVRNTRLKDSTKFREDYALTPIPFRDRTDGNRFRYWYYSRHRPLEINCWMLIIRYTNRLHNGVPIKQKGSFVLAVSYKLGDDISSIVVRARRPFLNLIATEMNGYRAHLSLPYRSLFTSHHALLSH